MTVRNAHERVLPAAPAAVGALLEEALHRSDPRHAARKGPFPATT